METKEILELKMKDNDASAKTIKEYLGKLLSALWKEGEGFSGKRPFGNSGWEYDLYKPLIKATIITGELDEDGYIDSVDTEHANTVIFECIDYLFQ